MISIIVPYWNSNLFKFRNCIQSLKNQSYRDIEILIILDGCKDDIRYLLDEECKNDSRIKVFYKNHEGVSLARNYGIKESSGEYIAFVDSDDFVEENYCEKLINAIRGYDMAICGVCEQFFPTCDTRINNKIFFSLPAEFNYLQYTNFSVNKLYKKSIIDEYKIIFPPDIKLGEDAIFLSEYYKHCNTISCISNNLYHYVINNNSATKKFDSEYWRYEKEVIHCQWAMFTQNALTERECDSLYAWLFNKFDGVFNYYDCLGKSYNSELVYSEMTKDALFLKLLNYKAIESEFWNQKMLKRLKRMKHIK